MALARVDWWCLCAAELTLSFFLRPESSSLLPRVIFRAGLPQCLEPIGFAGAIDVDPLLRFVVTQRRHFGQQVHGLFSVAGGALAC